MFFSHGIVIACVCVCVSLSSEELRPTQKQALTILCLHLLENKIWHRSVWYSKCNPNQEGSSQTKQSLESIIQQRFFNTKSNGLTPQRTGSTQSEGHKQTTHCQICSHATKQQNTKHIQKLLYCKPNCTPTQYQTKSQSPH